MRGYPRFVATIIVIFLLFVSRFTREGVRWPSQSQLSAAEDWYSTTVVSKKFFSLRRSAASLIHGNGFAAP